MSSIYNIDAREYNLRLAVALKEIPEFEVPEWASFVKSAPGKERPVLIMMIFEHKRVASILRQFI